MKKMQKKSAKTTARWAVALGSKGVALLPLAADGTLRYDHDGKPCKGLAVPAGEQSLPWSGKAGAEGCALRAWVGKRGENVCYFASVAAALASKKIARVEHAGRVVYVPSRCIRDGKLISVPQYCGTEEDALRGRLESRAVYFASGQRRNAGQTWHDAAVAAK